MNKEEAKKQIDSIINHIEWRHGGGMDYVKDDRMAAHKIIDQIESDHPKVKLPRAVGEDFDKAVKYLKEEETSTNVIDYMIGSLYIDEDICADYLDLSDWFNHTDNASLILADAFRYGWEAEKPKLWNVKVPHTKDVWYYKSLDGNLRTVCPADKNLRGKFTESEIEQYGLQDCEKLEVPEC